MADGNGNSLALLLATLFHVEKLTDCLDIGAISQAGFGFAFLQVTGREIAQTFGFIVRVSRLHALNMCGRPADAVKELPVPPCR